MPLLHLCDVIMKYNIPLKKSLNKIGVRLVNKCWMRFVAVMFVGLLESCCMCCSLVALLLVVIRSKTFCNISQCKLDFPEDLFEDVSEDCKDLMRKLMVKEPRYC